MTSLIQRAASEAMACAQVRRIEARRRLPPVSAAARLREAAILAAASPLAFDQLLAVCLAPDAGDGDSASARARMAAICAPPDPVGQLDLRRQVLALAPPEALDLEIAYALTAEERRGADRAGRSPEALAAHLMEAAELARSLWDHPALATEPGLRAVMLATAPRLKARAGALSRRPSPFPSLKRPGGHHAHEPV
jgi:hypothetical protein